MPSARDTSAFRADRGTAKGLGDAAGSIRAAGELASTIEAARADMVSNCNRFPSGYGVVCTEAGGQA
jgi:hypothetical protein